MTMDDISTSSSENPAHETNSDLPTTTRPRTLSLSPTPLSPLSALPTELVIEIFTLAATVHKPTAASLARTCRLVRSFIEPILYRTVVLHTKAQSELFERTVRSKDPRFFEMYLKHFAPVAGHEELSIVGSPTKGMHGRFGGLDGEMLSAHPDGGMHPIANGCPVPHSSSTTPPPGCPAHSSSSASSPPTSLSTTDPRPPHTWYSIKGVRSLLLSSLCRPTDESTGHARPREVAIKGFVKARFFDYPAFESVTHLFLCEVPMVFTNVLSEIVEARPYLPSLTHLACPFANRWRGPEQDVRAEVCKLLGIGEEAPESDSDDAIIRQPTATTRPPLSRLTTSTLPLPHPRPLRMLLINVFHFSLPDLERESSIWRSLASIPEYETLGRLYVQPGEVWSVRRWEESVSGVFSSGKGGLKGEEEEGEDVWCEARRRADGWRSWVRN